MAYLLTGEPVTRRRLGELAIISFFLYFLFCYSSSSSSSSSSAFSGFLDLFLCLEKFTNLAHILPIGIQ